MKILALEFSSTQRSVAVVLAGKSSTGSRVGTNSETQEAIRKDISRSGSVGASTAEMIIVNASLVVSEVVEAASGRAMKPLAMAEEALKQAGVEREQIETLAVGLGPGSYTGLRAAIALAQGWQLARGVKLLGVSSAEILAAQAQADGIRGRVNVIIDAQRGEFYLAGYEVEASRLRQTVPLHLATKAQLDRRADEGALLIGPEATRWFREARLVFPRAAILGRLARVRGEFVAGPTLEPIYLRAPNFAKTKIRAMPPG